MLTNIKLKVTSSTQTLLPFIITIIIVYVQFISIRQHIPYVEIPTGLISIMTISYMDLLSRTNNKNIIIK